MKLVSSLGLRGPIRNNLSTAALSFDRGIRLRCPQIRHSKQWVKKRRSEAVRDTLYIWSRKQCGHFDTWPYSDAVFVPC